MKYKSSVKLCWLVQDRQSSIAQAKLLQTLNLTAQEVEVALASGEMTIDDVGSCKIAEFLGLLKWIGVEEKAGVGKMKKPIARSANWGVVQ